MTDNALRGWGAHAPRVPVAAPPPQSPSEKFAMARRHCQHAGRVRSPENVSRNEVIQANE